MKVRRRVVIKNRAGVPFGPGIEIINSTDEKFILKLTADDEEEIRYLKPHSIFHTDWVFPEKEFEELEIEINSVEKCESH